MSAWFLRLLLLACCLIGSAFSTKLLIFGGTSFPASLLLLPIVLILTSLIQFTYGLKFSLQCIVAVTIANLVFIGYGYIITSMASPAFAINNVLFDSILQQPVHLIIENLFLFSVIPLCVIIILLVLQATNLLRPLRLQKIESKNFLTQSKYLSLIMLVYGVIILAANWYDPRFIKIFWFQVDSGTLVFPLTNILLDVITEVYGYKNARLAIWCGFLFNVIILVVGQIVVRWNGPSPINFEAYQHFLLFDVRIIIASFVSYFATEGISAYILAKLKILLNGRHIALRFISSTMMGYLIDVIVFCVIAFPGLMNLQAILEIMLTSWIMMAGIEMILLPLSVTVCKKLKTAEKIDIYDKNTKFTLLSLDHNYANTQNNFK